MTTATAPPATRTAATATTASSIRTGEPQGAEDGGGGGFGALGRMQIKVERGYVRCRVCPAAAGSRALSSDSAKDSDSVGEAGAQASSKHQKRKKLQTAEGRRAAAGACPARVEPGRTGCRPGEPPRLLSSPSTVPRCSKSRPRSRTHQL